MMKKLCHILLLVGILFAALQMINGEIEVKAEEFEQLIIQKSSSYDELMDYLDENLLISFNKVSERVDDYSKAWKIEIDECGWLVCSEYYYYHATYYNTPNVRDYLYSNKLLTNAVNREYDAKSISSNTYRCNQMSRYYVTPGTYYFQLAGNLNKDENLAVSLGFLSSKSLIDVAKIEYSEDYSSANVSFKTSIDKVGHIMLLNRGFDCNDQFFERSVNEMWEYNIIGSYYYSDEKKAQIDEIMSAGIEIKYNGTFTLLVEFMYDNYSSFPVSLTFDIDKIGTKPETIEVKTVKLNKTKATLKPGESLSLKATLKPKNVTDKTITWKSSNKKVATVDKNGKITAKKKGTCTITAVTSNGKKAKCKITVKK